MAQSTHEVLSLKKKTITLNGTKGGPPAPEHTKAAGMQNVVNETVVLTCQPALRQRTPMFWFALSTS